jgi:5-dehydro-2-deoxygluconokinase
LSRARLAELHRKTTGRPWPQVVLAFDHRRQLEALAERHAALRCESAGSRFCGRCCCAAGDVPARAMVDDRYGSDVLFALTGHGLWLARAVEKPAVVPLQFEHGPDITTTLRAWPAEQVAKVLVTGTAEQAAQELALAALYRACVATGHELLVEVIPSSESGSDTVCEAMQRYYAAGVRPDWWKLPPSYSAQGWKDAGEVVRAHDPHCRGMLILGLDADEAQLQEAFRAAAGEPLVRGFAVGRSIFWRSAEEWFAGRMDDAQAVDLIADNYARIAGMWQRRAAQ